MAHDRRFRFAVELHDPFPDTTWLDSFREVEQLGYATMFVPDHFNEGPGPIAAMAAAAAVTSEMKVGALVFDCDFRHPAVLSQELATIDHIAEGRLEVGLGAGWRTADYTESGITMDRPGVRVSRMIEHTSALKGLWAEDPYSASGEHYTIENLDGLPKPYTPGGPPILSGGGAQRVLTFAGASADIVGVNASIHSGEIDTAAAHDGLADRIDQKVSWVRDGAGERFAELELNAWIAIAEVTDDAMGFAELVAPGFEATPEQTLASPLTLIGSATEIAERLVQRRDRWGYSYHVIPGDKAHQFAPIASTLAGT